jgi:hypothetical protein
LIAYHWLIIRMEKEICKAMEPKPTIA